GVAGEVSQRHGVTEDGNIGRGDEGLISFLESWDFVGQPKGAQVIGAEGKVPHNVIVPIEPDLLIGTITNRAARGHYFPTPAAAANLGMPGHLSSLENLR